MVMNSVDGWDDGIIDVDRKTEVSCVNEKKKL